MKTFLNVLYRRILYKIPLKWLLLGLAIFGVLFASFSSANYLLPFVGGKVEIGGYSDRSSGTPTFVEDSFCIFVDSNQTNCTNVEIKLGNSTISGNPITNLVCITGLTGRPTIYNKTAFSCTYYHFRYKASNLTSEVCNIMSSLQCQTEYNLIPIDSVDSEYCENNNLCSSSDCPIYSGDLTPGVSNIFINDIFHPGAFNVIMNIPQEIDWDYAYTNSGQNMNIDVVGYNVDYEKIDSIVQFQNYKPSSEDFQKIIGLLAPYTKIIVFFVFLFIVWAWIKKPFKSKKL